MGIVARFDVLETLVVGTIGAPDGALFLTFHDVHVVADFVHRQFRFQCLNPLAGCSLAIWRLPIGGNVAGNAILCVVGTASQPRAPASLHREDE